MEWEIVDERHLRLRVPGGWVFKALEDVVHDREYHGLVPGWDWRIAMCFIPDPEHEWRIEK